MNIALQLYSVRDRMESDLVGTLERVAAIGYQGVEFAGYFGRSAADMKSHLDRLGLVACGSHVGYDLLQNDLEAQIAYAKTLGCKFLVCPWTPSSTKEQILEVATVLASIGRKLEGTGIGLAYHNHAHEMFDVDGTTGLDLLYASTQAELLQVEADTHWVQRGKQNPKTFVRRYEGRIPLIHIKDMAASGESDTAIGEGVMDIRGIWAEAEAAGTEWVIVEQETFDRPTLDCVALGFENLKKMGLVG